MMKIPAGIARAKSPHGFGLCPECTIWFFGEKCLKNEFYKQFFRQKLLQITICNFRCKNFFDCRTGLAFALIAQCGFLAKSALKMRCTKLFFQTIVVTYQKPQLLCYVTFFNILHHFGFVEAYGTHRESFAQSYGTDFYHFAFRKSRRKNARQNRTS